MKTISHVVCPYCQSANNVNKEDLGFEEFECCFCEATFTVPETFEELPAFNNESFKCKSAPTHYRVMLLGEDGTLTCLRNNVPVEWAELVCTGYRVQYTEGQRVFLEPEESFSDIIRMLGQED